MRLASIMTISCLLAAAAVAQEESYPPAVRAVLDEARTYCTDQGGQRVEFRREPVRKVDLTGTGRDSFIIDLTYAQCIDAEYAFCGSAGCELTIVVARRGGGYVRVFSQQVNGIDIEGTRGARTILFHLHGGYCGRSGAEGCEKRQRMSEKPFSFQQR